MRAGDGHLHLSVFEARDVDLHGGRHSAGWCECACKSKSTGTVKTVEGEWGGVNPTLDHHQRGKQLNRLTAAMNG